jgi:hypothetical protein
MPRPRRAHRVWRRRAAAGGIALSNSIFNLLPLWSSARSAALLPCSADPAASPPDDPDGRNHPHPCSQKKEKPVSEDNHQTPASKGNAMFGVKLFLIAGIVLALLWWVDKGVR